MSPSFTARRSLTAAAILASTALFFLCLGASGADALSPTRTVTGNATFVVGNGPAAKALKKSRGRFSAIAPAKGRKLGKRLQFRAPVRSLNFASATKAGLRGGLRIRAGKRKIALTGLNLTIGAKRTVVRGKLGGRTVTLFNAAGKSITSGDTANSVVRINSARLNLSKPAARQVRKALRLKRLPARQIGTFSFFGKVTTSAPVDPCVAVPNGPGCPLVDPYVAQCGVEATSRVPGTLPAAGEIAPLTGAKNIVGADDISWGFKSRFRSYVIFGATGSLKAVTPATVQGGVPVSTGFNFPVSGGTYASNDRVDTTDDQAIVPGTGTALFCATAHKFRVAISDPTIVIDGENSRIVATVDTNLTGVWTPAQRIDLATLDLSTTSPFYNKSGSEVTWSDVPVTLTQAGGDAICGTGEQVACSYTGGTDLDPIDVAVKTPYDTTDLAALATYVESELPFPITDVTQGGCTLPVPDDGNRTIDAAQADDPAGTPVWKADAGNAAPLPDLSAATAVTGGGFDWGFRSGLRGTLNSTGEFNLFGGATASNTYFGNGPGGTPRVAVGVPGQMAGAGKFFSWPASSTGGFYDPADGGKLVLKTSGRVAFCQTQSAQVYGIVFSNPTIVIDGANSRIQMDVATRYRLSWVRGTVDIASLDLSGITPTTTSVGGTDTVSWTFPAAAGTPAVGPVSLTADGEAVTNMLSKGIYIDGVGLDGTTIKASFPTPG